MASILRSFVAAAAIAFALPATAQTPAEHSLLNQAPGLTLPENGVSIADAAALIRASGLASSGDRYPASPEARYFTSLAAITWVQTNVSAARYSYRQRAGLPLPHAPEEALALWSGICGNQIDVAMAIFREIGIPARTVQFFYRGENGDHLNHIVLEVEWGGSWHMFDVTHGFAPQGRNGLTDVLSVADVQRGRRYTRQMNQMNPWVRSIAYRSDPLAYLRADADVLVGGAGAVRLPRGEVNRDRVTFDLTHVPKYFGATEIAGELGDLRYVFDAPRHFSQLRVEVQAASCPDGQVFLDGEFAGDLNGGPIMLPIRSGRHELSVRGSRAICYVVPSAVHVERVAPGGAIQADN